MFDFACRDQNFRNAEDFAVETRYTRCPRRTKNTATGSHAAPVASNTTSRRVPSGASFNAARSRASKLDCSGRARRRATT